MNLKEAQETIRKMQTVGGKLSDKEISAILAIRDALNNDYVLCDKTSFGYVVEDKLFEVAKDFEEVRDEYERYLTVNEAVEIADEMFELCCGDPE